MDESRSIVAIPFDQAIDRLGRAIRELRLMPRSDPMSPLRDGSGRGVARSLMHGVADTAAASWPTTGDIPSPACIICRVK